MQAYQIYLLVHAAHACKHGAQVGNPCLQTSIDLSKKEFLPGFIISVRTRDGSNDITVLELQ